MAYDRDAGLGQALAHSDSDNEGTETLEHHVQGALGALRYTKRALTCEEWTCGEWAEELATLWGIVRETCDAQGWPFFDRVGFPQFASLVYGASSKLPNVE